MALSLLNGGPSIEANKTLCIIADVMRRIKGDGPSMACMTCGHQFNGDLPPVIVVATPFADDEGEVIIAPICSTCAAKGQQAVFAGCIEQFRADGMTGVCEIAGGSA